MERPWLFGFTLFGMILILLWKFAARKHVDVEVYEYMEVLSPNEWKTGRQIRKEMEKLKGGWLSIAEVYYALSKLEDEEQIESRIRTPENFKERGYSRVIEYRIVW